MLSQLVRRRSSLIQQRTVAVIGPLTDDNALRVVHTHNNDDSTLQSRRSFHATPQREIVPILLVGTFTAYYSYRAWHRMQAEWDDYRWQLAQYEKKRAFFRQNDNDVDTTTTATTLAIDFGTGWTKLAATLPKEQQQQMVGKDNDAMIQVLITPQGDRSTFNGIVYDSSSTAAATDEAQPVALGKAALERFWFEPTTDGDGGDVDTETASATSTTSTDVILPFIVLAVGETQQHQQKGTRTIVQDVLSPILSGALDRVGMLHEQSMRKVITLPVAYVPNIPDAVVEAFQETTDEDDDDRSVVFVPEPVAAVWGAQQQELLPLGEDATTETAGDTAASSTPTPQNHSTVLVIDVGGWTTQVSLVNTRADTVQHSVTIPWGGEHMVQSIVTLLLSNVKESSSQSIPPNDARSLALLQLEARQVLTAFASRDRVDVLVPYLFPDPGHHNFETQLSRATFHHAVDAHVQHEMTTMDQDSTSFLSSSMPPPKDLSSLWVSVLARVLEDANIMVPHQELHRILVVGGGSKALVVQESVRSAIQLLVGPSAVDNDQLLVWPTTTELATELTVLGAASLPPSFDYSLTEGLVPR